MPQVAGVHWVEWALETTCEVGGWESCPHPRKLTWVPWKYPQKEKEKHQTSTNHQFFGFHLSFRGCRGFIGGHTLQETKISWIYPPNQDASHHQDYDIFRLGDPELNLKNATVSGWGVDPKQNPPWEKEKMIFKFVPWGYVTFQEGRSFNEQILTTPWKFKEWRPKLMTCKRYLLHFGFLCWISRSPKGIHVFEGNQKFPAVLQA